MVLRKFTLFLLLICSALHLNSQSIDSFVLVNADTNTDITVLTDGLDIEASSVEGINLNIRAETIPQTVGSVFFELSGSLVSTRTENVAPYALFGDLSGNYLPGTLPIGSYQLVATPFSSSNQSGTPGVTLTLKFSIVESVANDPPVSNITADPISGEAPLNVNFTGDSSTDDMGIAAYFWDFKDGNTSSEANPNHTFDAAGSYIVALTVTDTEGLSNTSSFTIEVSEASINQPPISNIIADRITGEAPLEINFNGDTSADDGTIVAYFWDFKDGNTSTLANPNHIFLTSGTYLVELTVTDDEGLSDTSSLPIVVSEATVNQPPIAILDASITEGNAPLEVTFRGSASLDDTGVTSYVWNFGDGGISTEPNPVHVYTNPGTYEAILTVSDSEGLEDTETVTITVLDTDAVQIQGELKKWHRVQLIFNGPLTAEDDVINPFLDYRLNVSFTSPTGRIFTIPGFYAADGNAAETSADNGNKWAVRFSPDEIGEWNYVASFRTGDQIAISPIDTEGTPTHFDGASGTFTIISNDKVLPDNRANGRLNYVGGHFYQYAETQTYFLKAGADSPENMLAYGDFDNTQSSKNWQPHAQDWTEGDPFWQGTKGKGLVGAINYLSNQGMNAFSFLTMNVNGDGRDVWPWASTDHSELNENTIPEINNRLRYDVSKMEQWEILFSHGDAKGMFLHFKTQETENDLLLDGGNLEVQRKLYYRELIARFGHHLALNWNLGEENDLYDVLDDTLNSRIIAYADYIHTLDAYKHPITIHSFPDGQNQLYTPLLGNGNALTGPSIQTPLRKTHEDVKKWVMESQKAQKPWAVANDEQGNAQTGVAADADYSGDTGSIADNRDEVRYQSLWGTLLAGGYGVEYYFGYSTGETDLTAQDYRSRETKWKDAKLALDFFHNELPFWEMANADHLTNNEEAFCLAKENESYVIYLPGNQNTNLDLTQAQGTYSIEWFDPINGGTLQNGNTTTLTGGLDGDLGSPPSNPDMDWVILVKKVTGSPTAIIDASLTEGEAPLEIEFLGEQSTDDEGIVSYTWDFDDGNGSSEMNPTHIFENNGVYTVSLTVEDTNGFEDMATLAITVAGPVQEIPITVEPIENQTNLLGEVIDSGLKIVATGGDGGLKFNATGLPPGVGLNSTSGLFSGTIAPNANVEEPYVVNITVDDSDENSLDIVTISFNWMVNTPVTNQSPEANISASILSGDAPLEVSFTGNESVDDVAIAYYIWDFGNGDTATEENPTYIFNEAGIYEVSLTVGDDGGLEDTATVTVTVNDPNQEGITGFVLVNADTDTDFLTLSNNLQIPSSAIADISLNVRADAPSSEIGSVFLEISGAVQSTRIENVPPYALFGNVGENYFGESLPTGSYVVSATPYSDRGLTGEQGETLSISFSIVDQINNEPPVAIANANPIQGVAPLLVDFTGNGSSDDVGITEFIWDFGDNAAISNESNPSYTFNTPGTYNVSLTVVDEEGLQDTANLTITVEDPLANIAPTAILSASLEFGEAPLEVSFTGDQSFDDILVTSYSWSFGNGSTSNLANPIFTFDTPGNYNVTLTVEDAEGLTGEESITIQVNDPNLPPTASINATPLVGNTPLEVDFVGDTSTDDKGIVSYAWDFDDGNVSNLINPTHTFLNPGLFEVTLVVTDQEGLQDVENVIIQVNSVNQPPNALATATPLEGTAPLEVNFTGDASSDDTIIASYFWDFKDGTTSTLPNPAHTFSQPGEYNVLLTVTDNEGLQNTVAVDISVLEDNPEGITGFTLVNAQVNGDILELTDNIQIASGLTNGVPLNIRANTNPTVVGSVVMELQGVVTNNRTENVSPYALFGDLGGDYLGSFLPEGNYTISATPYTGSNGSGTPGNTVSLNFSIVSGQSASMPMPKATLDLSTYPNPAYREAHLSLSENRSKIEEVNVYDILGRKIKTVNSSRLQWENGEVILPITELEEGFYYIVAITQSLEVGKTKMVVKEK